ncbi:MAG TPA: ATP-binding protein [Candidatus Sulfotelmatobacter sp.]|jgi:hypothetical protein
MALKIIAASEAMTIDHITLTLYGAPGLGKSSLAFTADKPLMLDFDKGSYRAQNRKDSVVVQKWADVAQMTAEDLAPYNTLIVDTAGRALDAISMDIIAGNPKMGRGGSLSLQGYGELKSRFAAWQNFIRSLGKDLVLICHMQEDKNGDDLIERIDAQGASKNEIYKSSDAMARLFVQPDGTRALNFDPREGGFGKNPAQLPKMAFPHPDKNPHYLADVIAQIKGSINKMTSEQAEATQKAEQWTAVMGENDTLDLFNSNIVPLMKEGNHGKEFTTFAAEEAKRRGYKADKKSGLYTEAA